MKTRKVKKDDDYLIEIDDKETIQLTKKVKSNTDYSTFSSTTTFLGESLPRIPELFQEVLFQLIYLNQFPPLDEIETHSPSVSKIKEAESNDSKIIGEIIANADMQKAIFSESTFKRALQDMMRLRQVNSQWKKLIDEFYDFGKNIKEISILDRQYKSYLKQQVNVESSRKSPFYRCLKNFPEITCPVLLVFFFLGGISFIIYGGLSGMNYEDKIVLNAFLIGGIVGTGSVPAIFLCAILIAIGDCIANKCNTNREENRANTIRNCQMKKDEKIATIYSSLNNHILLFKNPPLKHVGNKVENQQKKTR